MSLGHLCMLLGGVALAAWNLRLRLGRTPHARGWARNVSGEQSRRAVLVVHPLLAMLLVLGGLSALVDGGAAALLIGAPAVVALVIALVYLVLPVPVPGVVQPRWYRRVGDGRTGRV